MLEKLLIGVQIVNVMNKQVVCRKLSQTPEKYLDRLISKVKNLEHYLENTSRPPSVLFSDKLCIVCCFIQKQRVTNVFQPLSLEKTFDRSPWRYFHSIELLNKYRLHTSYNFLIYCRLETLPRTN